MSDEEYEKLWKRARGFALTRGYHDLAQDFAQYVCEKKLKGRESQLRFLLIDFLRTYPRGRESLLERTDLIKSPPRKNQSLIRAIKLSKLRGTNRATLLLLIEWGLSQREIANLWGISESAISLRIREARKILDTY